MLFKGKKKIFLLKGIERKIIQSCNFLGFTCLQLKVQLYLSRDDWLFSLQSVKSRNLFNCHHYSIIPKRSQRDPQKRGNATFYDSFLLPWWFRLRIIDKKPFINERLENMRLSFMEKSMDFRDDSSISWELVSNFMFPHFLWILEFPTTFPIEFHFFN